MTDATCYESHMRFPTDMKPFGKVQLQAYMPASEMGIYYAQQIQEWRSLQEKKEESFKGKNA